MIILNIIEKRELKKCGLYAFTKIEEKEDKNKSIKKR